LSTSNCEADPQSACLWATIRSRQLFSELCFWSPAECGQRNPYPTPNFSGGGVYSYHILPRTLRKFYFPNAGRKTGYRSLPQQPKPTTEMDSQGCISYSRPPTPDENRRNNTIRGTTATKPPNPVTNQTTPQLLLFAPDSSHKTPRLPEFSHFVSSAGRFAFFTPRSTAFSLNPLLRTPLPKIVTSARDIVSTGRQTSGADRFSHRRHSTRHVRQVSHPDAFSISLLRSMRRKRGPLLSVDHPIPLLGARRTKEPEPPIGTLAGSRAT